MCRFLCTIFFIIYTSIYYKGVLVKVVGRFYTIFGCSPDFYQGGAWWRPASASRQTFFGAGRYGRRIVSDVSQGGAGGGS